MKHLRYLGEAILVYVLLTLFRFMPAAKASDIGGAIGRSIGPKLAVNRRAIKHLQLAFPDKSRAEIDQIITGMWDNLGRLFAEYPHLETIAQNHTTFSGLHNFIPPHEGDPPAIFMAGHIGNWEVAATKFYTEGIIIDLIYRAPNNPWVDRVLKSMRSLNGKIMTHPKSKSGMKKVVERLRGGHNLGILIDQKYNSGLEANFFGRPAMTSPAFAQLAQKFGCRVYPIRVEREIGCDFVVTVYPPLDTNQPIEAVINEAHGLLEQWISEHPEQWIWLHRRWKDTGNPANDRLKAPESLAETA